LKKLVLGFALTVMMTFPACAQRFCPESDFEVEVVEWGGSMRIVRYVGNSFDVRIPPSIGGLPVTHIGEWAFAGMNWDYDGEEWIVGHQLTNVFIPDSIVVIEQGAFMDNKLTSITIPNSVIEIGHSAFSQNLLTRVTIPNSVTNIGSGAFRLNQLTSVAIPDRVINIGNSAFSLNRLSNVTIPSGVTNIGWSAFSHNELTSVTIPDSVTSIGDSAFAHNQLVSVTIPSNVTNIRDNTFWGNPLTDLTINMVNIPDRAFSGSGLTSVTIGDNVMNIGDRAFSNNRLTNVAIPGNVTHIGYRAFFGNQLTTVTIANGVTHIDDRAFSHNLRQFTIPTAMEEDRMISLLNRVPPVYRGRVRAAFRLYDIDNLLPADDRSALLHMFPELNNTNIFVLQERPEFLLEQIEGLLAGAGYTYEEWLADAARFPFAIRQTQNQITSIDIPDSVSNIGDGAFAGNPLASVTIPIDTLIGHGSFDQEVIVTRR